MKIECSYSEIKPIHTLVEHPRNPNKHPDKQIKYLAKIMDYQGWRHPIIVSKRSGFIVSGHGRLMAAKKNGWDEVPIDVQEFESEADEWAHLIADNKIAELAEHDDQMMFNDLKDFPDLDLELLGIPDLELPLEVDPAKDEIEDDVPSDVDTRCKPGDVWLLGDHRLFCGDATNVHHVDELMGGVKADITFTSPPYNLGDNAKLRGYLASGKDTVYTDKKDHKTQNEYLDFINSFTANCIINSSLTFVNIQLLAGNKTSLPSYWHGLKDYLVDLIIWDKEHGAPPMAKNVMNSAFEMIFIFSNEHLPKRVIKTGKEFHGTIPNIYRLNPLGKKDPLAKDHGAVFPVQFAEYFLSNFSKSSCLDPFGGSGSTLIACEKTNRKCFMMEIDPHYCDVILTRWEKYADKKAELLSN